MQHSDRLAICSRMERNGLVAAECAALTGGRPGAAGVADCKRTDRIGRGAFVHQGIRVLATAGSFDQLVDEVRVLGHSLDADGFRIDVHDPLDQFSLSGIEIATALADAIPFGPNLSMPRRRFLVVSHAEGFVFGDVIAAADAGYRRHDSKPWTTSSSLDSRFARALINLVPDARSILDPCCGAGSVVVEAASLGLEAFGVDWKVPLVGMTRENLAHFGYRGSAVQADSRTYEQRADAVVTDIPYGHAIDSDEGEIRAIIEQCAGLAPQGVFVAPADITEWLDGAGYTDIEVHTVMKRRGFTRWIHVVRSTRATQG